MSLGFNKAADRPKVNTFGRPMSDSRVVLQFEKVFQDIEQNRRISDIKRMTDPKLDDGYLDTETSGVESEDEDCSQRADIQEEIDEFNSSYDNAFRMTISTLGSLQF
jgi:hypothetical protein